MVSDLVSDLVSILRSEQVEKVDTIDWRDKQQV